MLSALGTIFENCGIRVHDAALLVGDEYAFDHSGQYRLRFALARAQRRCKFDQIAAHVVHGVRKRVELQGRHAWNGTAEVALADATGHLGQSHDRRREPQSVEHPGDGCQDRHQQADHDHDVAITGRGPVKVGHWQPGVEQRDRLAGRIDHDCARRVLLERSNTCSRVLTVGQAPRRAAGSAGRRRVPDRC